MIAHTKRYEFLLGEFYDNTLKCVETGGVREVTLDCSIGRDQGRYLYNLVREADVREVLEIGMAWGGSSMHIAAALEANTRGRLIAVDPYQMSVYSGIAVSELKRLKVEVDLQLIQRKSDIALPQLLESDKQFEFIFIDGDHRFDGAFIDFHYSQQLVKNGGHLVFDDAQSEPLKKLLSFIDKNFSNLHFVGIKEGRFAHYIKEHADNRPDGASFDF